MKIEEQLIALNAKPFYYYKGTTTICLLSIGNKWVARGISICSPRDNFVKCFGRTKALGRAVQALIRNESSGKIIYNRFDDNEHLINSYIEFGLKSVLNPILTKYERGIIHEK